MEVILKFIANFLETIYIFVKDPIGHKKKNKDKED